MAVNILVVAFASPLLFGVGTSVRLRTVSAAVNSLRMTAMDTASCAWSYAYWRLSFAMEVANLRPQSWRAAASASARTIIATMSWCMTMPYAASLDILWRRTATLSLTR